MATTKTPSKGSSSGRTAGGSSKSKTSTGASKATRPASKPAAAKTATASPKPTGSKPAAKPKTGTAKSAETGKTHGMSKGAKIATAAGVAAATAAAGFAAVRGVRRRIEDSQRTQIHLMPEGERWKVQIDGNATATSAHDTKDGALAAARELAHERAPSQLIIHRQNGSVQTRHSYNPER